MTIELKMPALSPTMEKGTLAKWLVAEGDIVKVGDLVAEIETDKATMEFEAADEGRVARLLVAEGSEDVLVGTVIAVLADAGESVPAPLPSEAAPAKAVNESVAAPVAAAAAVRPSLPAPAAEPRRRSSPSDRIKVSPLAQRIADAKSIDLSAISGTGPNGRIVRNDLGLRPIASPAAVRAPAPVGLAVAPPPTGVPVETAKLSSMRRTIARRLSESKQSVPHFYLTARCTLDALLALRAELNVGLATQDTKISINDMLIKAMALALIAEPDSNVQFGGDVLHHFDRVDISMAVAIDGGLVTPVIRDAGNLSLSSIARTSKTLADKARNGKMVPEDYEGGTASISNLGMFGIDEMIPVINPPQALILGIGAGIEQPWKVDGAIGLATVVAATASFDHRAIDGAAAARFMAAFRYFVEVPIRLCV